MVLAFYYKPDPNSAYESIEYITNDLWAGWLVRGMHKWGASVFIILLFLHMGRVFLFGAYKYPRELNWILGVLILVLGMLEGFAGYLLPWDETAYWATVVGINLNGTAPFLGPFIAQFLRGGSSIGPSTLSIFYSIHMLVIPGALAALIGLHIYLVTRLGVGLAAVVEGGVRRRAAGRALDERPGRPRAAGRSGRWGAIATKTLPERNRAYFKRYKEDVKERGKPFFPYAIFHDTVMSLVVVLLIVGLAVLWKTTVPDGAPTESGWLGPLYTEKADPGTTSFVPRPDWFFYFLFYLLRIFKWPNTVVIATVGIPTICIVVL